MSLKILKTKNIEVYIDFCNVNNDEAPHRSLFPVQEDKAGRQVKGKQRLLCVQAEKKEEGMILRARFLIFR